MEDLALFTNDIPWEELGADPQGMSRKVLRRAITNGDTKVRYEDGVFFTSGQHKGAMLRVLLDRLDLTDDIDSIPPATATCRWPALIACAASMTALSPEPHTLLRVKAGVSLGIPARIMACRAGFWPWPACRTLPMMTSSTATASMPAR